MSRSFEVTYKGGFKDPATADQLFTLYVNLAVRVTNDVNFFKKSRLTQVLETEKKFNLVI